MSFLGAFQDYHQIALEIITMSFGLKNTRVKYQSMVTRIFTLQIGGNKQDYE